MTSDPRPRSNHDDIYGRRPWKPGEMYRIGDKIEHPDYPGEEMTITRASVDLDQVWAGVGGKSFVWEVAPPPPRWKRIVLWPYYWVRYWWGTR